MILFIYFCESVVYIANRYNRKWINRLIFLVGFESLRSNSPNSFTSATFPYSLRHLVLLASAQIQQELKINNKTISEERTQSASTAAPNADQASHAVYTQVLQSDVGLPASCFCLRGSAVSDCFCCFARKLPQGTRHIADKTNTQAANI